MGLFLISRIYSAIPRKSQNKTVTIAEKTKNVIIESFIVLDLSRNKQNKAITIKPP